MQHRQHLTTPTEVVAALYDACREAEGALAGGDDSAALAAMRSIDDLVDEQATFHLVRNAHVCAAPITQARRVLAARGPADRIVSHRDLVVVLASPPAIDVFRVDGARVDQGWCLLPGDDEQFSSPLPTRPSAPFPMIQKSEPDPRTAAPQRNDHARRTDR